MGNYSLLDLATLLLRNKKRLLAHFFGAFAVSVVIALVIPKSYKATTNFLPPLDRISGMNPFAIGLTLNLGGPSEFTPHQIEAILDSRTVMEYIVRRFDLEEVYKTRKSVNSLERAMKILRNQTSIKKETQSGFAQEIIVAFNLSVVDKDAKRAADMANAMVDKLNETLEELSNSEEQASLNFIKSRLDSVDGAKAESKLKLAAFQKENKIYSPNSNEQVLATVSIFAELKKQKILSEIERDILLLERERDNPEVLLVQKKIAELNHQMTKLEKGGKKDVLPPLGSSVDIAYQYIDMKRDYEIQTQIELMLRRQYEEARIKAAEKTPLTRVVDRAVPPQWKNSPKRSLVVIFLLGLYMFGILVMTLAKAGLAQSGEATRRRIAQFQSALRWRGGAE